MTMSLAYRLGIKSIFCKKCKKELALYKAQGWLTMDFVCVKCGAKLT